MPNEDATKRFRKALGSFATGVTIVTTCSEGPVPIGVTASSFNSVSVDPPLVLWSLAKTSRSYGAFRDSGHFAIHVLAESQEAVSNRFARSGEDKFAEVDWQPGILGSPLLSGNAAVFECQTRYQYEGGDHVIFVGEVIGFEVHDVAPLLFHDGTYAERRPRPKDSQGETVDLDRGEFTDDFLSYLLARAYFQTSRPERDTLARLGLDQQDYLILVAHTMRKSLSFDELHDILEHTGLEPGQGKIDEILFKGLLARDKNGLELSEEGRSKLIELLAVGRAYEIDLANGLTRGEMLEMKRLLRRLIDLTGSSVPLAWRGP